VKRTFGITAKVCRQTQHRLSTAGLALACMASVAQAAPCGPVTPIALAPAPPNAAPPADCEEGGAGWRSDGGIALWRCPLRLPGGVTRADIEPGAMTDALFVLRDGKVLYRQADVPSPWGAKGLMLMRVDLSGDAQPEILLAAHNTSGQGMGVEHWTLTVFDTSWLDLGARMMVADWGPDALVPRADGKPGCAVLVTTWREMEGPGDTISLHFVGERADVSGELARFGSAPDEAFVARHYDHRFARERLRDMERASGPQRTPSRWLRREIAIALAEKDTPQ
jgi:hypothetical protein